MSKMKSFVPNDPEPEPENLSRRDKVLNIVTISFACLVIAAVLRGLFELWQHWHP